MEQKPRCQSCGIPVGEFIQKDGSKAANFGTNMDGSTNSEYCSTCFQKGTYTDPDETLETMMEKTEMNMIENLHFPTARAHDLVEEITPKLKRWKRL